jgi:putative membrane protein
MKTMHKGALAALCGLATATVALAQQQPRMPPSTTQATGTYDQHAGAMESESRTNGAAAAAFVDKAAQAGMTEVQLGKLALQKSSDAQIRKFAQQMVTDHSKAGEELAAIAKAENLQVPGKLDSKHADMVRALGAKSGAEFDAAYAQGMMQDHVQAVALFESAQQLPEPALAQFAAKTLPTLQEHKRMAQALGAARVATSQ